MRIMARDRCRIMDVNKRSAKPLDGLRMRTTARAAAAAPTASARGDSDSIVGFITRTTLLDASGMQKVSGIARCGAGGTASISVIHFLFVDFFSLSVIGHHRVLSAVTGRLLWSVVVVIYKVLYPVA